MLQAIKSVLSNFFDTFDFGYVGIDFSTITYDVIALILSAIVLFLPFAFVIKIVGRVGQW